MIDGLDNLLEEGSQPGLVELRSLLQRLLGGHEATGKLLETCNLVPRTNRVVYRLRFALNDGLRSLVIKRLEPEFARRTELAATRWLPAVGLGENGPPWLGAAAERSGQCVWHVYDDLGDWPLDPNNPELERVRIAVELIARVHTRFADHPLLPECRRYGGDRGGHFFTSNVRDAIRCLESVPPDTLGRSAERSALRDRLLARLNGLLAGQTARAQALAELGGPETLLHGDLWTTNTFVFLTARGLAARLIDWDHAAVGPVSYDLSTFLLRFQARDRLWILDLYRGAAADFGWHLPASQELNGLFETAELARFAHCLIWPAMALARDGAEWGFDTLAEIERWFDGLQPILPETGQSPLGIFRGNEILDRQCG